MKLTNLSPIQTWVIGLIIASIMRLCAIGVAGAQTFTLTNASKPVIWNTVSTSKEYTFSFYFKSDTGTHELRSVPLWSCANQGGSLSWQYLNYNSFEIQLNQKIGYQTICDGNFHKLTFRIGKGVQEVLIDSILLASQPYGEVSFSGQAMFSSTSDYDRVSGTIKDPMFVDRYVSSSNERPMPKGTLFKRNLPVGLVWNDEIGQWDWSNVKPLYIQLSECQRLAFPTGAPKIHLYFDFFQLGGQLDSTVSKDSAIKAGVMIAKYMADYNNCDVRAISNSQNYWDYKDQATSEYGKFNAAMLTLANSNAAYQVRVDCSLSQLDDLPPFKTITTEQFAAMYPNEPLSTFDGMAGILETQYRDIQGKLNKPILFVVADNEYANKWLDTAKYELNPACKADKEASHLSWWGYCSQQYTNAMNRIYAGIKRACPSAEIVEYDVNCLNECNYYYDPKFQYRIALNTNRQGTDQLYPRNINAMLMGYGDYRGLLNYEQVSKRGQTKSGYNLNTPFVGVGYLGDPNFDIDATHIIGLETFLVATGSASLYPALFIQGGNNPNPKSLATQLMAASIAQAACKNIWDVVLAGSTLPGDRSNAWSCYNGTNYTFWFGDFECIAGVRQIPNTTKYAISTFHGAATLLKTDYPYKKAGGIWLNGKYIPLEAGAQTFVYTYDSSKPYEKGKNPKRVNSWVKLGSMDNWPKAVATEE